LLVLLVWSLMVSPVSAVPPTDEAIAQWVAQGVWEQKVAAFKSFTARGGNSPELFTPLDHRRTAAALSLSEPADTVHILTILVDFSDNHWEDGGVAGDASMIDSVLYSQGYFNPSGSMTDFYLENSYGTFLVQGDIFGWYEMPQTYEYYEGGDDGLSRGKELARDAVLAVAAQVPDFGRYDSNGDGYCDGLVIIHAGPGAETGAFGIWSHKSNIDPPLVYDGVSLSAYTMNPEEYLGGLSPIGVFCHEYGHFLGLPDFYDIDYDPPSSRGLGNWALMASGSYNGDSRRPAQLIAWSKAHVGFLEFTDITSNEYQTAIPSVEDNPVAYRLYNDYSTPSEYWVVENKQPHGFDIGLPYWGLCIFHVDENAPWPNVNHLWYHVAMEQADGANALALANSRGDAGDPYPGGSGARAFNDLTIPNSHTNDSGITHGITTQIGVWNISNSDSVMYADFDVAWSRPYIVLADSNAVQLSDAVPGGDGDGRLEPGETVQVFCTAANRMRPAYNARLTLATNSPYVTFINDQTDLAAVFDTAAETNVLPIEFVLADAFVPTIDSFTLTIECDSTGSVSGGEAYTASFGFEANLGPPQVLIVDDDRGDDYEEVYADVLHRARIPYALHHVDQAGAPSAALLNEHRMAFWHTGDSSESVLTASDAAAMKEYLDSGGRLLLSSISGAHDLALSDSSFMHDYLGAVEGGTARPFAFDGVAGNPIGDGTKYRYVAAPPLWSDNFVLSPVGSGQAAFSIWNSSDVCAVTVDSTFHSVFASFPIEYIGDAFVSHGYATKDTLLLRVINFFGGIPEVTSDPGGCCEGIRGDIAEPRDGSIDISDLVYLVDYMFRSGPAPTCFEEADVNGDQARPLEISDLLYLIDYIYLNGQAPAACP